jgi:mono/diheme cytochrome c family protein
VKQALLAALFLAAATGVASADGQAVFDNSCAFCHQAGGVGVPGQFPRLAGRAGTIAATAEGKAFLPKVLLNGMSGRVTVDGQPVLGIMPGFDSLSDDDIAAVLTYVSGLDHAPVIYGSDDIKKARAEPKMSPTDLAAAREDLAVRKIVP